MRVPFDPPLEKPNQFQPTLITLINTGARQLGIAGVDDDHDDGGRNLGLSDALYQHVLATLVRKPELLRRLREETATPDEGGMQIGPEQGQLLVLLLKPIGAQRVLEIGTFTSCSDLWMALALPDDGALIACDVSAEYTSVGRRYC